ncbi:MAG: 50S ribosomal protein L16 [Candidatus Spechtbacteria bacterium RIFCSPLOWO2_01_FULL_46_10]|uniref:Large ribosomal subunit protein uL16 n=1 Tax=Candidatus Spechtbacteria bacterium RIFCSPLOWO2_01_FULL_46_10 TaxID=1802163 RepID=A0A1G2HFS4_9BACT|nr:MAG: 50S ribosomal protein L16 [Candidatus Spechtbacteria bacterium RIFCSPLOWO2_01_FULL_46_10]
MLLPKKVKHRKWWKGHKRTSVESRGTTLVFGEFGLQVVEGEVWITSRQLEAARRAITHYVKRGGRVWIRVFPDKPVTQKGAEVGMGGGKGSVDHYVFPVQAGRIIFEMDGVTESVARGALERARHKLPIKTKFITRD